MAKNKAKRAKNKHNSVETEKAEAIKKGEEIIEEEEDLEEVEEVEEEELDALIMEEFDELGYAVDEEHSNLNVEEDKDEEVEVAARVAQGDEEAKRIKLSSEEEQKKEIKFRGCALYQSLRFV